MRSCRQRLRAVRVLERVEQLSKFIAACRHLLSRLGVQQLSATPEDIAKVVETGAERDDLEMIVEQASRAALSHYSSRRGTIRKRRAVTSRRAICCAVRSASEQSLNFGEISTFKANRTDRERTKNVVIDCNTGYDSHGAIRLKEITGKKRDRIYAYQAYLDVLSVETDLIPD